jgi:hypothetical protein
MKLILFLAFIILSNFKPTRPPLLVVSGGGPDENGILVSLFG